MEDIQWKPVSARDKAIEGFATTKQLLHRTHDMIRGDRIDLFEEASFILENELPNQLAQEFQERGDSFPNLHNISSNNIRCMIFEVDNDDYRYHKIPLDQVVAMLEQSSLDDVDYSTIHFPYGYRNQEGELKILRMSMSKEMFVTTVISIYKCFQKGLVYNQ